MINHRENNIKTFAASLILVIVIAAFAVAGFMVFGGESPAEEDRFPWIVSDHAALNGMLDGTFYEGEKNSAGKLSYKIAGEITVDFAEGKGDFKIEENYFRKFGIVNVMWLQCKTGSAETRRR